MKLIEQHADVIVLARRRKKVTALAAVDATCARRPPRPVDTAAIVDTIKVVRDERSGL